MNVNKNATHWLATCIAIPLVDLFHPTTILGGISKLINNVIIMTLTGEGVDSQGLSGMIIA